MQEKWRCGQTVEPIRQFVPDLHFACIRMIRSNFWYCNRTAQCLPDRTSLPSSGRVANVEVIQFVSGFSDAAVSAATGDEQKHL